MRRLPGGVDRNIEVVTAAPSAGFQAFAAGGQGYAFAYSFGMDFNSGRFHYQFGNGAPGRPNQGAARPAAAPRPDPAALAAAHPGLAGSKTVVLHRYGTDPDYHAWRAGVVGRHGTFEVKSGLLNPTPLFGLGLVDAIPDAEIEAGTRRKPGRVPGRVSRLPDGRVGRFGWKAQAATLGEFVASAAAGEIGLEVPGHRQAADPRLPGIAGPGLDLDAGDVEALTAFVRALPAPAAKEGPTEAETAGAATFRVVGCAGCHVPDLGGVAGLYSDLLLHEMDQEPADSGPYAVFDGRNAPPEPAGRLAPASAREWRTPPLWGLAASAPYLHDGRAETVDAAVRGHGGQGAESARRYARLSERRREQLLAFLASLEPPVPAAP